MIFQADPILPCVCSVVDHSKMTLKCGMNKKATHETVKRTCHWYSTTFWRLLWVYYWTDARQHGIYLYYKIKKLKKNVKDVISVLQLIISKNQSNARITQLIIQMFLHHMLSELLSSVLANITPSTSSRTYVLCDRFSLLSTRRVTVNRAAYGSGKLIKYLTRPLWWGILNT